MQNYGKKLWFCFWFIRFIYYCSRSLFSFGILEAEDMMEKTLAKLPYFFERIPPEDLKPMTVQRMQQFSTALRLDLQKNTKGC